MSSELQEVGGCDPRAAAMEDELQSLSRLNAMMFRTLFSGDPADRDYFSAKYDKTDPEKDGTTVDRRWNIRIEGDFYFIERIGDFIYIVFGDATGHHAYAGGLRLFVAVALQRIFERARWDQPPLRADAVLIELERYFGRVGRAALRKEPDRPLEDGVNAIVVRISRAARELTYATAGIPIFLLSAGSIETKETFEDGKGLRFPRTEVQQGQQSPFEPRTGTIHGNGVPFVVLMTDGFRDLKRETGSGANLHGENNGGRPDAGTGCIDAFWPETAKAALVDAVARQRDDSDVSRPAQIAKALVDAARAFRRGHFIPEGHDDDRLVLVFDLDAVWKDLPIAHRDIEQETAT